MDVLVGSLLERMVSTSLQTAALATTVWLLCRCMPRLAPSFQCWLWWLVALQALAGLVFSPIELSWLPQPALAQVLVTPGSFTVVPDFVAPAPGGTGAAFPWQWVAFVLWAAGVLVMAWFTLRERARGQTLLADSFPCDDESVLQSLTNACETCGVRRPGLRLSCSVSSPILLGHRSPVLLLPAGNALCGEELDMALTHELTHIRRGDLWWGLIPSLVRHLFFFHPFVHLAVREYGTTREAACDAAVVERGHRCREYGRLLVRVGTSAASQAGLAVASPTFRSLSRRLTMLQNTSFISRAGSVALLAIVATGVLPLRLVAAAGEIAPSSDASARITPDANELPATSGTGTSQVERFLDMQIEQSERNLRRSEAQLASKESTQADIPDETLETRYNRLVRDHETARVQYEQLLLQRLAAAEQKLADLRLRFTDKHPEVQILLQEIGKLKAIAAGPELNSQGAYTIGPDDRLQVNVWQHPELTVELPVRPDGRISMPLVENVLAVGKTPSGLSREIEAQLARYVRAPRVSVIVTEAPRH